MNFELKGIHSQLNGARKSRDVRLRWSKVRLVVGQQDKKECEAEPQGQNQLKEREDGENTHKLNVDFIVLKLRKRIQRLGTKILTSKRLVQMLQVSPQQTRVAPRRHNREHQNGDLHTWLDL
jgi:hypothetical protein